MCRKILRFLRCREQTLRQAPTYMAALQKLCCTKPRAAIATLWGFGAACQGEPQLSPGQMVSGLGRMSELRCSSGHILGHYDALKGSGVPSMRGDACASAQTGSAGGAPTLSDVRVAWLWAGSGHDVSYLGVEVLAPGICPRSKVSMILMRPPQHGHGGGSSL
jgi:hypothetical protein